MPICYCECSYRGQVLHCAFHLAAPDMLEALRWYLERDKQAVFDGILEDVSKCPAAGAITKAEGENND